jgi:hypothetical protein
MFIELVDSLRCVVPHEETWLVASVSHMDGRHVVDGTLGCPVCYRQYVIRDGAAWFTATAPAEGALPLTIGAEPGDDDVVRAAALLGLTEPGGIVVLGGSWAAYAAAVVAHGAAHAVTLNMAARDTGPQEISALVVDDDLPFATGSVRAIALEVASAALLASAARTLRRRGRLVAPADAAVPDGMTVLARDAAVWVGERATVSSPPIPIRSARR